MEDLAARVERLESIEAIRELHNQYCFIQDRGHSSHGDADVEAFLGLCSPDVVWDNSPDESRAHRGREAVATYLRGLWARFDDCMHLVHNLSIRFEGRDRATGRSSFEAFGTLRQGPAFLATGTYEDVYVRSSGTWRFALHREVPFFFVRHDESWAGPKPRILGEWTRGGGGRAGVPDRG